MTWAHWTLIIAGLLWVALMWLISRIPIQPDEWCDCRDCVDTIGRLEIEDVLGPYTVTIPVDGDQLAFDRKFHDIIEQGWR